MAGILSSGSRPGAEATFSAGSATGLSVLRTTTGPSSVSLAVGGLAGVGGGAANLCQVEALEVWLLAVL